MATLNRSLRRAGTRSVPSYLFVAAHTNIKDLELTLQTLPLCARGQVFVLNDTEQNIAVQNLPARFSLTCVSSQEKLQLLLKCWAAEMLCDSDAKYAVCFSGLEKLAEQFSADNAYSLAEINNYGVLG